MIPYPACQGDCAQGDKPCPCPFDCQGMDLWEAIVFWAMAGGPAVAMLVIAWWVLS